MRNYIFLSLTGESREKAADPLRPETWAFDEKDIMPEFKVLVDSSYNIKNSSYPGGWERDFTVIPYIQILVMDNDIYTFYISKFNYNCDSISNYVPILHCYQLKLEDLQRMNWTVVYPPE